MALRVAEVELDSSIAPIVNLEDETKPLKTTLMQKLSDSNVIAKARIAAKGVIKQLESELSKSHWFTPRLY